MAIPRASSRVISATTSKRPPVAYKISDGITQSMLQSFLRCRQRSTYETNGWRNAFSKQSANRGTLWHKALELHYQNELNVPSLLECYEKSFKDRETVDKFAALWPAYVQYWAGSDKKFSWKHLELEFKQQYTAWPSPNPERYLLRGKIDGVVNIGGEWFIFETKTKARIDEDYICKGLEFDFQTLFYITNMRARGIKVVGVKYNVIRDPNIKDLDGAIRRDPSHFFKRFEHTYSEKIIKGFQDDLRYILRDFAALKSSQTPAYKNPTACYSGGMTCPFLDACAKAGEMIGYKQTPLFEELGKEAWLNQYCPPEKSPSQNHTLKPLSKKSVILPKTRN